MDERKVYHVVHDRDDDLWKGRLEGGTRASVTGETQGEVIEAVRELARRAGKAQVVVHRRNGQIRTEWTYEEDPYPPPG